MPKNEIKSQKTTTATNFFYPETRVETQTETQQETQIEIPTETQVRTQVEMQHPIIQQEEDLLTEDEDEPEEKTSETPRRSQRNRKPPEYLRDYVTNLTIETPGEPMTYEEAKNGPESNLWLQAMKSEYESIIKNNTWELCDLPPEKNLISSKWVFKKKLNENGQTKYKARLVARGFNQIEGLDYQETYSPVVRFTSLRTLFAHAAQEDLDIYHWDVETAFLHGELEEEIYLKQPEGFAVKGQENKVLLLKKALYGLKQGSRVWNKRLDSVLKGIPNIQQSKYDLCIYYLTKDNETMILAVFVDDIIVFTNSQSLLLSVKTTLFENFSVRDLGKIKRCFGINVEVDKKNHKIYLDQSDYIESIIKKFGMQECKSVVTPLEPGSITKTDDSPKSREEIERLKKIPYQSIIGSLMYAYQGTRPDLAYAVSTLSKFNNNFDVKLWHMAKRVLRYLQGTKSYKLCYSKQNKSELLGFCDASFASEAEEDRRSVTGYAFKLQNAAISWNCARQATIALSSTEAEYQALTESLKEALWLRNLTIELRIQPVKPITVMCDNKGAIDLAHNASYSKRTKHIDYKHYFIKERIERNEIIVDFVSSENQEADALTKPVSKEKLIKFVTLMGIIK